MQSHTIFKVLFADYHKAKVSMHSFDLTTRKMQTLIMRPPRIDYFAHLAYDPVTQLLFWNEDKKIYSLSLKPASSNEAIDENLILTSDDYCIAIAVDRCGGYIYWVTADKIQRTALDGSKKEVLIDTHVYHQRSLAIDQQTEKMYWIEETTFKQFSIENEWKKQKNILFNRNRIFNKFFSRT